MADVPDPIARYWDALVEQDFEAAAACLHDDFTEDWPQSRERIVGRDNWLAMVTHHPTFPSVRLRSHDGEGSMWVTEAHFDYPTDGAPAPYEVCAVQRVADGKVLRIVEYFAAPFEAAGWRRDMVERISE